MASEEECILLFLLHLKEKEKRRKCRRRRWYVRPLNTTRDENGEFVSLVLPMRNIDEERHFQYFRMTAEKFEDLLSRVMRAVPRRRNNHRNPVGPSQRLAVTLRYLTTGISLQALSASYKMGTSTVSVIVEEMCDAIWDALQGDFLAFPSLDQWQDIADDFWAGWQFPHCLGAIDGKHVRLRAPSRSGSDFYNYKGFFSLVLMAVADAHYRFTYVNIGAYGRESDGGVLSRSQFGSRLAKGNLNLPAPSELPGSSILSPFFFLGDEAFPLQINLMRPYSGENFFFK